MAYVQKPSPLVKVRKQQKVKAVTLGQLKKVLE